MIPTRRGSVKYEKGRRYFFPSALYKMTDLTITADSNYYLSAKDMKDLSQLLSKSKGLHSLKFSSKLNNLQATGAQGLGKLIEEHSNTIQELYLNIGESNKIGQAGSESIFRSMLHFKQIQKLSFQLDWQNNIGAGGVLQLAMSLKRMHTLLELQLVFHDVSFREDLAQTFGESLGSLVNLIEINLVFGSKNVIGAKGGIAIGQGLKCMKLLQKCSIEMWAECKVGSEGIKGIALGLQYLTRCKQLRLLFMQGCCVSDAGGCALGLSLSSMNELEYLHLEMHEAMIGNNGADGLGQGLQYCQHVTDMIFIIRGEKILGRKGVEGLANGISQMRRLEKIKLNIRWNKDGEACSKAMAKAFKSIGQHVIDMEYSIPEEFQEQFDDDMSSNKKTKTDSTQFKESNYIKDATNFQIEDSPSLKAPYYKGGKMRDNNNHKQNYKKYHKLQKNYYWVELKIGDQKKIPENCIQQISKVSAQQENGRGLMHLFQGLGYMKALKRLKLQAQERTKIEEGSTNMLIQSLSKLCNLQELIMDLISYKHEFKQLWSYQIGNLNSLNNLIKLTLCIGPQIFGTNQTENMEIQDDNISNSDVGSLSKCIEQMQQLLYLDLRIGGQNILNELDRLSTSIGTLKLLISLNIKLEWGNNVTPSQYNVLFKQIEYLRELKALAISINNNGNNYNENNNNNNNHNNNNEFNNNQNNNMNSNNNLNNFHSMNSVNLNTLSHSLLYLPSLYNIQLTLSDKNIKEDEVMNLITQLQYLPKLIGLHLQIESDEQLSKSKVSYHVSCHLYRLVDLSLQIN